jgi:hypothetical protein
MFEELMNIWANHILSGTALDPEYVVKAMVVVADLH